MAFLSDGWLPRETRERYGKTPIGRWESASRRAGVVENADEGFGPFLGAQGNHAVAHMLPANAHPSPRRKPV